MDIRKELEKNVIGWTTPKRNKTRSFNLLRPGRQSLPMRQGENKPGYQLGYTH